MHWKKIGISTDGKLKVPYKCIFHHFNLKSKREEILFYVQWRGINHYSVLQTANSKGM